ncbi:hypothetical protein Bca52824_053728 [Brassica carinata]|uniref:Uncharacterized protein n=1 Tax=Brassica carinata TaxID=52824 RepID=A0A8X7R770_BRACI|nr:hypothetical protein Bca52824_053728 [Brassica carinata]
MGFAVNNTRARAMPTTCKLPIVAPHCAILDEATPAASTAAKVETPIGVSLSSPSSGSVRCRSLLSPARPSPDQRGLGRATGTRRIASTIVTPSRGDGLDGNVTKRLKGTPRSLAFDTLTEQDPKPTTENDQVIEALDDMDITEQLDDGLMDSEIQDDDLMGVELAEMEAKSRQGREVRGSDQKSQRQRIAKASDNFKKQRKDILEMEMTEVMFQCLIGNMGMFNLNIVDLNDFGNSRMELSESSNNVAAESSGTLAVVEATTAPAATIQQQQQFHQHVGLYEQPLNLNLNHKNESAAEQMGFPFINDNHHQQQQQRQIPGVFSTTPTTIISSSINPATSSNPTNNTWFC